jgi:hypothetical protein
MKEERARLSVGDCLYRTATAKIRHPEFAEGISDMGTRKLRDKGRNSYVCSSRQYTSRERAPMTPWRSSGVKAIRQAIADVRMTHVTNHAGFAGSMLNLLQNG